MERDKTPDQNPLEDKLMQFDGERYNLHDLQAHLRTQVKRGIWDPILDGQAPQLEGISEYLGRVVQCIEGSPQDYPQRALVPGIKRLIKQTGGFDPEIYKSLNKVNRTIYARRFSEALAETVKEIMAGYPDRPGFSSVTDPIRYIRKNLLPLVQDPGTGIPYPAGLKIK